MIHLLLLVEGALMESVWGSLHVLYTVLHVGNMDAFPQLGNMSKFETFEHTAARVDSLKCHYVLVAINVPADSFKNGLPYKNSLTVL